MASPEPITPPPGPLSSEWKQRGWVSGQALKDFVDQCIKQRLNRDKQGRKK